MCGQQPHGWTKAGGSSSMSTGLVKAEESSPPGPDQTAAVTRCCPAGLLGHSWHSAASACAAKQTAHTPAVLARRLHAATSWGGPAEALSPLSLGLVHCFRCRVHRKVQGSSWRPEGSPCCSPSDHHTRGTAQFPFFCLLPAVAGK